MKDKKNKNEEVKEFDVDENENTEKIEAEAVEDDFEIALEGSIEEQLKKQIDELKHEVEVTKNAYYKAYADADNFKKRLQNEAEQANKYRIQSFAMNILPAIDSLELALNGKDTSDPFVKGVKLTYDQLMNALEKEGVSAMDVLNKPFDANYSHALMSEKIEGVEPNMVVEVLQKGYMLKDRILRAALVKVSE